MKKAFFLGLCLLNIVFFAWEYRRSTKENPAPLASLPTIPLAGELERARRGAAVSAYLDQELANLLRLHTERVVEKPIAMLAAARPKAVQKVNAPKSPMICQEIGPFADLQAATQWLARRILQGQVIYKDVLTPADYQVYYPPAKTAEQTRIQKLMLNAKGITDVWQIPSGELKGAFSLGVFSDQARAVLFKNQLAEKGIKAEVIGRQKSLPRIFVRVRSEQKITSVGQAEGLTTTGCNK